jgi:hypothetical protein
MVARPDRGEDAGSRGRIDGSTGPTGAFRIGWFGSTRKFARPVVRASATAGVARLRN